MTFLRKMTTTSNTTQNAERTISNIASIHYDLNDGKNQANHPQINRGKAPRKQLATKAANKANRPVASRSPIDTALGPSSSVRFDATNNRLIF